MTNIIEEKSLANEPIKEYGITITFKNPLELTHTPKSMYYYTRVIISKYMGESTIDFRLMPEFTIQGRIHYHGIFKIYKFNKWVKTTLPRLRNLGYCKIETFKESTNKTRWTDYMYKNTNETKNILGFKDDISIEVNINDYKQWKLKQPDIETFVGKPKLLTPPSTKKKILLCQLPNDSLTDIPNVELHIDENNEIYYKHIN